MINVEKGAEGVLEQFRQSLYASFAIRRDVLQDTVDALSGNQGASSVAELSLNPLFGREYSSLYDGIDTYTQALTEKEATQQRPSLSLPELMAPYLEKPRERPFWLLGADGTPLPRPYGQTVAERTFVYAPNPTPGVKPVTVGHAASSIVLFPEKAAGAPAWVVPLGMERIGPASDEIAVALEQLQGLLANPTLPFAQELTVTVADSKYGQVPFLHPLLNYKNHVVVVRVRNNRVFYRSVPTPAEGERPPGRPKLYGARFALNDAESWGAADHQVEMEMTTHRGQTYQVSIQQWNDLLMRGKRTMPMGDHAFHLLRIQLRRPDGTPLFRRPMWLAICGQRRAEIDPTAGWQAYRQRFDQEHFFRFGKQRLLLDQFQTPEPSRTDTWLLLVQLAYLQLWLARSLADALPLPWQRYMPQPAPGQQNTPAHTQRAFPRIIRQIGSPAKEAKPRGKSPGRPLGTRFTPRPRQPIVRKT